MDQSLWQHILIWHVHYFNVHDYQTYTLECTTQFRLHTHSVVNTTVFVVFVILYTNDTCDNYLRHLYRGSFYLVIRKKGKRKVQEVPQSQTAALPRPQEEEERANHRGVGGGGGVKALLQLANFTLGPDATLNTEIHKNSVRIKNPKLSQCIKAKT